MIIQESQKFYFLIKVSIFIIKFNFKINKHEVD